MKGNPEDSTISRLYNGISRTISIGCSTIFLPRLIAKSLYEIIIKEKEPNTDYSFELEINPRKHL